METLHFGIRSGKLGAATDHVTYVTRKGPYEARNDLAATGYGNMPAFAQDQPMLLWQASERNERKNGSTFRSYTISLPNILTIEQLTELAWQEARRLAGTKPFQFALHITRSSLRDELHPHVHIVICDRLPDGIERSPEQMFRRYNPSHPEKGGCRKDSGGKTRQELHSCMTAQRKAAADEINTALAKHGHDQRVDHRTLRERGIKRAPERYLGPGTIRKMTKEQRAAHAEKHRGERQTDDRTMHSDGDTLIRPSGNGSSSS